MSYRQILWSAPRGGEWSTIKEGPKRRQTDSSFIYLPMIKVTMKQGPEKSQLGLSIERLKDGYNKVNLEIYR